MCSRIVPAPQTLLPLQGPPALIDVLSLFTRLVQIREGTTLSLLPSVCALIDIEPNSFFAICADSAGGGGAGNCRSKRHFLIHGGILALSATLSV